MAGDARVTGPVCASASLAKGGEFFDHARLYLVCAAHGAVYATDTGLCVPVPAVARLLSLAVRERDG